MSCIFLTFYEIIFHRCFLGCLLECKLLFSDFEKEDSIPCTVSVHKNRKDKLYHYL